MRAAASRAGGGASGGGRAAARLRGGAVDDGVGVDRDVERVIEAHRDALDHHAREPPEHDVHLHLGEARERSRRPANTGSAASASSWWAAGAWATSWWQARGHTMEPNAGSTCQGAGEQGVLHDRTKWNAGIAKALNWMQSSKHCPTNHPLIKAIQEKGIPKKKNKKKKSKD